MWLIRSVDDRMVSRSETAVWSLNCKLYEPIVVVLDEVMNIAHARI
jgi:hypothetical protein